MGAIGGEIDRFEKRSLERRVGEETQRITRHGAVVAGSLQRVGKRAVAVDPVILLHEE